MTQAIFLLDRPLEGPVESADCLYVDFRDPEYAFFCFRAGNACERLSASEVRFSVTDDANMCLFGLDQLRCYMEEEPIARVCEELERLDEANGNVLMLSEEAAIDIPSKLYEDQPLLDGGELVATPYSIQYAMVPRHAQSPDEEVRTKTMTAKVFREMLLPRMKTVSVQLKYALEYVWVGTVRVPEAMGAAAIEEVARESIMRQLPTALFKPYNTLTHARHAVDCRVQGGGASPVVFSILPNGEIEDGDVERGE